MMAAMSVRSAAIWSMAGQYIVFATQFVVNVVISRYFLSPAEVGLFSIALSSAMLIAVLQDFGITRYIAGHAELTDDHIRTCFSVSAMFAIGVGLILLVLAWPISVFYHDPRLLLLLVVIAASYLFVPFGIVPSAVLQRNMDFRSLFIVNIGAALAGAVVSLALAASGFSAFSLAWAVVAQQAARAVIGQWRSGKRLTFPLRLAGAGPVFKFGSEASALYITGALGVRTPELIIGALQSFAAVGLFGRAVGLAGQLLQLVSGAIGGVFFPAFARLRDNGEPLAPAYLRVVAGYSATTWPAMAFLAAAATPLILILYGSKWASVAPLLFWIALSEIAFTALPLHMDIPIVLGRMRRLLQLNLIDTGISVILLIAGSLWGVEWAAVSRIGYGMLWFTIYAAFMHRLLSFSWAAMTRIYLQSLVCTCATVAPLLGAYLWWQPPAQMTFPVLAGSAIAGCLCWAAALFAVRHPVRLEFLAMGSTLIESIRPAPRVHSA